MADAEARADLPASFVQRFRRKQAQQERPPAESVSVELAAPLPARGAGAVAQALLKHLLFIRQQIPMPFDQLAKDTRTQQQAQECDDPERRLRRPSASQRKTAKLVEQVEAVLDGFNRLPHCRAGKQILGFVISFGPTPINPKEAYILRVHCEDGVEDAAACPPPDMPAKKKPDAVSQAASKLIRCLISSGLEQMDSTAPAYKVRRCRPIIINVGTKGFLASGCPAYLSGVPSSTDAGQAEVLCDAQFPLECELDSTLWLQHQVSFKGLAQQAPDFD